MAKFEWKAERNPNTGEPVATARFTGELVSIAEKAIANKNTVNFYPATVKYENVEGKIVSATALVYENNFIYGMSVGTTYLGKAVKTKGKPMLFILSHLDRASNPTDADLGFSDDIFDEIAATEFDSIPKK
jgi:hypothetical protein